MNSISLAQVSAFVVAVSMASFLVNADDAFMSSTEDNIAVPKDKSSVEDVVEVVEEPNDSFTFTSLDSDKNGKLSQEEVLNGKNDWLVQSFKEIDSNADESITEQELMSFVARAASTSQ